MLYDVRSFEFLSYDEIREAYANVITQFIPTARVPKTWCVELDDRGFKKVTAPLYGLDADSTKVHCWMIGISAAQIERSKDGDFAEIGSNTDYEVILNIDFWGFFEYSGVTAGFNVAERETRLVQATLNANRSRVFEDHAKSDYFLKAYPFDINSIDQEIFAGGEKIIISQNTMQIQIREKLS